MKTLDEVIKAMENCYGSDAECCDKCQYTKEINAGSICLKCNLEDDALHYLKEFRVVTDICHKHGIASVWGQVLPDVEKTDWDKKLNLDNAFNNDPLTWQELKQMEGKPVWIFWPEFNTGEWMLLDSIGTSMANLRRRNGRIWRHGYFDSFGTSWQAYWKERSWPQPKSS